MSMKITITIKNKNVTNLEGKVPGIQGSKVLLVCLRFKLIEILGKNQVFYGLMTEFTWNVI